MTTISTPEQAAALPLGAIVRNPAGYRFQVRVGPEGILTLTRLETDGSTYETRTVVATMLRPVELEWQPEPAIEEGNRIRDRRALEALPVGSVILRGGARYTKEYDGRFARTIYGDREVTSRFTALELEGTLAVGSQGIIQSIPNRAPVPEPEVPDGEVIEEAPELTLSQYQQRFMTIVLGEVNRRVSRSSSVVQRAITSELHLVRPDLSVGMFVHRNDHSLCEALSERCAVIVPANGADGAFTADGHRLIGTAPFGGHYLYRVVSLDGSVDPLPWAQAESTATHAQWIQEFLDQAVALGNRLCGDDGQGWCSEYETVMSEWFDVEVDRDE